MSFPGPGRDTPSSGSSQNQPENPFIRFKRFADSRVAFVLQGILGLPSAFSGSNTEPKARWAKLDDYSKRQDDLKATEWALKDSEARRHNLNAASKTETATSSVGSASLSGQKSEAMDDEGELCDVPLYSPVTKSLFAHLDRSRDRNQMEWRNTLYEKCWPREVFRLYEDQISSSPLGMVQAMAFNTWNRSAGRPGGYWFESDLSVLPYIMFSPYSPLALSIDPTTAVPAPIPVHTQRRESPDEMGWCDAFEDLLLVSSGRHMPQIRRRSEGQTVPNPWKDQVLKEENSSLGSMNQAAKGMNWIIGLKAKGLLEAHTFFNYLSLTEVGLLRSVLSSFFTTVSKDEAQESRVLGGNGLPETEEDVHEFFYGLTSRADNDNEETTSPFSDLISLVDFFTKVAQESDSVEVVADQEKAQRDGKAGPGSPDKAAENSRVAPKFFSLEAFLKGHPPTQRSTATQTDMESDSAEAQIEWRNRRQADHQMQLESLDQQSKNRYKMARLEKVSMEDQRQTGSASYHQLVEDQQASDCQNDRVVSTITTTEQTMSVDGTKMTTVSVSKRFADGRVVTTETYRSETPSFEDSGKNPETEQNGGQLKDYSEQTDGERNRSVKGRGKGWFWN